MFAPTFQQDLSHGENFENEIILVYKKLVPTGAYGAHHLSGVKPVFRGDKTTSYGKLWPESAIFFGRKRDFLGFFVNGV